LLTNSCVSFLLQPTRLLLTLLQILMSVNRLIVICNCTYASTP
jgi:hypothetical protein